MSVPKPTLAIFGATGGCTASLLSRALIDGYHASALARTPSKLEKLLSTAGVPGDLITSNLTIIQGDVRDPDAVLRTIRSPTSPTHLADFIHVGVGASPVFQLSLIRPISIDNPNICAEAASTIVGALDSAKGMMTVSGKKPIVTAISTTGISKRGRDVPLAFYWLYKYFLAVPHQDKEVMEEKIVGVPSEGRSGGGPLVEDFVVVRASLLTGGVARGLEAVREGWELPPNVSEVETTSSTGKPAVGYTISREDVGLWLYERVIKGSGEWNGRMATVTY